MVHKKTIWRSEEGDVGRTCRSFGVIEPKKCPVEAELTLDRTVFIVEAVVSDVFSDFMTPRN